MLQGAAEIIKNTLILQGKAIPASKDHLNKDDLSGGQL
jgi:hypothetical protein